MQHAMRENTKVFKNAHKRAHASLHKRVLIEKERHNMPSVLITYKKIISGWARNHYTIMF